MLVASPAASHQRTARSAPLLLLTALALSALGACGPVYDGGEGRWMAERHAAVGQLSRA